MYQKVRTYLRPTRYRQRQLAYPTIQTTGSTITTTKQTATVKAYQPTRSFMRPQPQLYNTQKTPSQMQLKRSQNSSLTNHTVQRIPPVSIHTTQTHRTCQLRMATFIHPILMLANGLQSQRKDNTKPKSFIIFKPLKNIKKITGLVRINHSTRT